MSMPYPEQGPTASQRRVLMHQNPNADLQFAIDLAQRAGAIMLASLGARATAKTDGTPVTAADKQINDLVHRAVSERGEQLLGEEDEHHAPASTARMWVCDPIDGTWLLAGGVPGAVFSLALVENGRPLLGVVYDPWTRRMVSAVKGEGAFLDGRRLSVNSVPTFDGACLALPGGRVPAFNAGQLFSAAIAENADVVTTGSAVHDALLVPLGFAAAAVYPYTSPWDMAAIAVIVTEAGGKITDLNGAPQRYDAPIKGAVVSNGCMRIHDHLNALIGEAAPQPTVDAQDVLVIRAAYRGELGWDIADDGTGRFLFVLGPQRGQVADAEFAGRIRRLAEEGLLAFDGRAGYSSVTTLPRSWRFPMV